MRKVLAVATLAALPVFVGVSQSALEPAVTQTETAHTRQMTERPAGPQWAYVFGMGGEIALIFGIVAVIQCSFFGPFGSIACGVTAVL